MDFSGRRVLITGASSGIGRAVALRFAQSGAHVVATGRNETALEKLRADIGAANIEAMAGDVTDAAFVNRLVEAGGAVDILVNCAGTLKHTPFLEGEPADWSLAFETNVLALLRLTQLVARGMCQRGGGHIFNLSSILARQVYRYTLVYAATKYAVRAISQGLRIELAPHGVKVTEIAPGLTETAVLREIDHPDVIAAYSSRGYPPLVADEIADAILYAAATGPNACPDVIEVNPLGQV